MSEESEKEIDPRVIMHATSAENFVRFLIAKGADADAPCSVCGKEDWTILCPEDDGPTLRLSLAVRNRQPPYFLGFFGYYCANCGFTRLHLASHVHEWVEKNPDPASDVVSEADLWMEDKDVQ